MESTNMDQSLITRSGRDFLRKHWRILYVVVGLVAGCCLTVGFSYLALSLEKETGQGNRRANVNAISNAIKMLENSEEMIGNVTASDSSDLEKMLTTHVTANYTHMMNTIFGDYMKALFTKKEGSIFTNLLESVRNDSLLEMRVIKEIREEIILMIEGLKNVSCPSSTTAISTTTPATTGPCRHGELLYSGHCYYFEDRGHTWEGAQEDCRKRNSNLVKIEGYSEWYWLKQKVNTRSYHEVWIGAHDKVQEGSWRWVVDSSKVTYTRWASGEPNNGAGREHCASMKRSSSYRWNDLPCTILCHYVCERS